MVRATTENLRGSAVVPTSRPSVLDIIAPTALEVHKSYADVMAKRDSLSGLGWLTSAFDALLGDTQVPMLALTELR